MNLHPSPTHNTCHTITQTMSMYVCTMHMYRWQIFSCCFLYCSSEWLCYTDAEREGRLVPIIVGAIIGFLMMVVFFAYMAAFSKRKCAERRAKNAYVRLGNDIDSWESCLDIVAACCVLDSVSFSVMSFCYSVWCLVSHGQGITWSWTLASLEVV